MRYEDLMAPQALISERFSNAVKLSAKRAYQLAQDAGLDQSMMSKVVNRVRKVRTNDPRILKLGKLVGLKQTELFEPVQKRGAA